ncbi:hypothetical protein K438DRAFT_19755 [Mycena galopus ATCC 62051]|nr:hypothetical protein K438DRAFT_19755 [Mycena galopus ATCC 62051]
MGQRDTEFGTSLLGSWLGSLFCGVAFSQAYHYFSNFPNDTLLRKGFVTASLFFCVLGLVGEYVDVYKPTVTLWGNPAVLLDETWSVPLYTISNALVGIIVNSFLISRFYSLSKNILISVVLCLIALLAFIMAFISVLLYRGVANIQKALPLALVWTISSAVADVSIATSLVWTLRGMRSTSTDTNRLIRRVILIAIQNGCTTSLLAIGGMIASIILPNSNVAEVFLFQLGPAFVCTLLSNFNLREAGKSGSRTQTNLPNLNTTIVIDGIHVLRTAIVTTDGEIEMGSRKGDGAT